MPSTSLIQTNSQTSHDLKKLPGGVFREENGQLTIHRCTTSHHGTTLGTLGHAAEYLAESRAASMGVIDAKAEGEAIHILMSLSREVFDEYAAVTQQRHPVTDWIMNRVVRVYGAA